jgi:hypothetical protein
MPNTKTRTFQKVLDAILTCLYRRQEGDDNKRLAKHGMELYIPSAIQ